MEDDAKLVSEQMKNIVETERHQTGEEKASNKAARAAEREATKKLVDLEDGAAMQRELLRTKGKGRGGGSTGAPPDAD